MEVSHDVRDLNPELDWKEIGVRAQNKYGARRTCRNGIWFDSKSEADRYDELLLQQQAGVITKLGRQVSFDLTVNAIKCGTYRADFIYFENDMLVVEDVKGYKKGGAFAVFRLKKMLMLAIHGIDVRIMS